MFNGKKAGTGYAHAWDCGNCPKNGDPAAERSCPMWWEMLFTNGKEEKIEKACGYVLMPRLLIEVIKASNRPAAAIESTRNEIAVGLGRIAAVAAERYGIQDYQQAQISARVDKPRD